MDWLVDTAWLHDNLTRPDLRIIDIRGEAPPPLTLGVPNYHPKPQDYAVSHIPGALFLDWTRDITDPDDPIPVQLAPPARFAESMARLGITDATFVVAYDDHNNIYAGRLWWALRYYGQDAAAVLSGGWPKWVRENRPITSDVPTTHTVVPGSFTPRPRPELRKVADQVWAEAQNGALLLDTRPADEYAGRTSKAIRAGHIPGALSLPTVQLLDEQGAVKRGAALSESISAAGVSLDQPDQPIITYCNGGVNASLVALALGEAGFTNVSIYDGSWNEWGNTTDRPIDNSNAPDQSR